ncbi:cytochrome P460 family protein [Ancylobacter sp. MQZ15Z-1]|uniref:Cytochrome P460 family protein n=1 Tax=Ancylobacter mangrovi TaxID=2972472 RepID=A0A9X2PCU2_9HYPH|nr:cytochrome P460 family protein [Ancylobacter mangrovi]MCS0495580.1 cytochrome P460 family protein [Ancylobacter mangrovi]
MKSRRIILLGCVAAVLAPGMALGLIAPKEASQPNASPNYGVTIPDGYRRWALVAPALEAAPINELRAVVANDTAIDAYRSGPLRTLVGPDFPFAFAALNPRVAQVSSFERGAFKHV